MAETTTYHNALQTGSMLAEYRLEAVLGAGGFGMTYLGWDTHLEKHVAIKEYLPTDLAVRALDGSVVPITTELKHNYQWGLDRFLLEARTLAKFSHPHIVRVNRYFESHGTGYMVMDYEKGQSLSQILKASPAPDEARLKSILMPLLDGLQQVHAAGFLHRDIKPANIFVRDNGSPVLIDFGASRQALGGATRSITAVLTPGYAPLEQYSSDGNQGPWTDIYAMAGVLYRAFANDNPPDAVSRLKSDAVPGALGALRGRVSEPMLRAMEWALTLEEKRRPQTVQEWKRVLEGAGLPPPSAQSATMARPGASAPAAPQAARQGQTVIETRRVTRPPRGKEPSHAGRWLVIGFVAVGAALAAGAWNKQRAAKERERLEVARSDTERAEQTRKELERAAAERRRAEEEVRRLTAPTVEPIAQEQQAPPPSAPAAEAPPAPVAAPKPALVQLQPLPPRERPGRERDDRPGPDDKKEKHRQLAEQEFRAADSNGDGYLSPDEVRGRFPAIERDHRRVDFDGDGRISPHEFIEFRRMQAEQFFRKKK